MDSTEKRKRELVEKLGILLEKKEHMAPVAARIFSYIILTGKQGTTFEDLVENLCASKSTISTHLNHLQDLRKLEYFTKTGDRKKYFIINTDFNTMVQRITDMVEDWKREKQIHLEIMDYKKDVNVTLEEQNRFELDFHIDYIKFLDGATSSINKLKETLKTNKTNIQ
ncbi:transcriptional regulator [Muricauda ruestringensis]|uniref:Transcriptional regulator n=1 Tax=Flagellimonas aurea TaxID=2915619 RepID=A0ABS3G4L1_9FLAO|nr:MULTISPECIES: transcriptional regulator [Allomuricauda]MBC73406.1 transcriptional regulator [Allomuricauda sp.]MBO0353888.1 transcriptional regulator [Allomuricauda aurea]|tara:strand:- start:36265 stop:36768 length:504 start_codon:yes stop_codon:yes gene_type:complete